MKLWVVLVGIISLGLVSGSWDISNSDFGFRISEVDRNINEMKSIIKIAQNRGGVNQKIISYIDQYNSQMDSCLKSQIARTIFEMNLKYGIGIDTILAVITWESALTWRPNVVSPVGAIGLMQIMPGTGNVLAKWEGLGLFMTSDLADPIINIKLGCRYLAHLMCFYNGSLEIALAAYNGGPKNARLFRDRDQKNCHPETWGYVPSVMALVN